MLLKIGIIFFVDMIMNINFLLDNTPASWRPVYNNKCYMFFFDIWGLGRYGMCFFPDLKYNVLSCIPLDYSVF